MAEKRKLGGKKAVHLVAAVGATTMRDRIWAAIRAQPKGFSKADIAFAAKASDGTVRSYFEALLNGGYLRALDRRPRSSTCPHFTWMRYELARDVGVQAPRLRADGSEVTVARERMWQAVRILGEFSAREVQLAVNASGQRVSVLTAKSYILQLARGGYVALTRSGHNGVYSRYCFLASRNTGPRSPIAQKSRAIFDPNLGRIVWPRQPEARA